FSARNAAAGRVHRARASPRSAQLAARFTHECSMTPKKIRTIFRRFKEANPSPKTELEYRTPFELLVAVILSAQATDRSVNLATRKLFQRANTPQAMLELGVEGLARYIRTIGLFNT